MPLSDPAKRNRTRELKDAFHKTLDPTLGRVMLTSGVSSLPSDGRAMTRSPALRIGSTTEQPSHAQRRTSHLRRSSGHTVLR
jgi:hypothetical protein